LPVPAEAQIETARGLAFCEQIAAAPGLEALVLGPGDLAASLGVPELTIGAGAHVEYALDPRRGGRPRVRAAGGRRPVRRAR
jgi:2,4-dihydroxyhept-2-ene-1,7-dioic acid aldolase